MSAVRTLNPKLFPRPVLSAQGPAVADALESLHPAESALVAKAVDSRRNEFATGRRLAHRLLRELGVAEAPLLPDAQRAPRWPAGAVGSITHSHGWCAVAVAPAHEVAALGIDVDATLELPEKLWEQVLTDSERRALRASTPAAARASAMRIFSAKEALYKAQYPLTGSWLGFEEAELEFAADGSFTVEILAAEVRRALEPFELWGAVEVAERITATVTLLRS